MMRKINITVRVVLSLLIFCTMLSVAGCTPESPPLDPPTITPSDGGDQEPVATPTDKADAAPNSYVAVKGAASEYELYTTVVGFLNNGFHYADLSDIFDITLSTVFYSKWQTGMLTNFTQGMSCEEAYKLFSEMKKIASQMKAPTNDEEAAQLDFDAFKAAFPADKQQQITENENAFKTMIVGDFFRVEAEYREQDGINPFRTTQTTWTVKTAEEYSGRKIEADVLSEDVISSFPAIYAFDFDEYVDGKVHYNSEYYYTEIGGRYYLLGLVTTVEANAAR